MDATAATAIAHSHSHSHSILNSHVGSHLSSRHSGYGSASTVPLTTIGSSSSSSYGASSTGAENIPIATIAPVGAPFYNDSLTATETQQRHQYYQSYMYPAAAAAGQLQSLQQYNMFDSYVGGNFQYATNTDRSSMRHASTHTSHEKATAGQAKLSPNLAAASAVGASNHAYKHAAISGESSVATTTSSKPQAAATAFYAQPLHSTNAAAAVAASAGYFDAYKYKMSAKPPNPAADYSNYGNYLQNAVAATYQQQQQQYYTAAKSQLQDVNYSGAVKPLAAASSMRQHTNSFYGGASSGSSSSSYYDKYDKYASMYGPTAVSTSALPGSSLNPVAYVPPHYPADAPVDSYRKASTWHWNMDYPSGSSRTLAPTSTLPTATVPPTNASYLPQATASRDAFYAHEKYAKYDKYNSYYHQQYARNVWPNSHVSLPPISERLPHNHLQPPTASTLHASHHYTAPATSAAAAAATANARQNYCSQPYQQQNSYYQRVAHNGSTAFQPLPQQSHYVSGISNGTGNGTSHSHANSGSAAKYNSISDYSQSSKLKSSNDLYALSPFDTPSQLNFNYAAKSQRYPASATTAAHQSSNVNTALSADATNPFYNDLSLQSTYENYTQSLQQPQPQHQLQSQMPPPAHHPSYAPTHPKQSLLDYRKPTTTQNTDCYMTQVAPMAHSGQAQSAANYPNYDAATGVGSSASSTLYNSNVNVVHPEKAAATKNISIRDFLTTWNDDEEDYAAGSELNFMATDDTPPSKPLPLALHAELRNADTLKATPYANENTAIVQPTYKSDTSPQQQHQQKPQTAHEAQQSVIANHLQYKGCFGTRPKMHMGLAVDGPLVDVATNQYINLPDIVIDTEKSNSTTTAMCAETETTTTTEADSSDVKESICFADFDVEKELDQLQGKKHKISVCKDLFISDAAKQLMEADDTMSQKGNEADVDFVNKTASLEHNVEESTNSSLDGLLRSSSSEDGEIVGADKCLQESNMNATTNDSSAPGDSVILANNMVNSLSTAPTTEQSDSETQSETTFDNPEQFLKDIDCDTCDNASLSNESTFEKEYETFINKIGNDADGGTKISDGVPNTTGATPPAAVTPAATPLAAEPPAMQAGEIKDDLPLNLQKHVPSVKSAVETVESSALSVALPVDSSAPALASTEAGRPVKADSQDDPEFTQSVKDFSKFYKRKRKLIEYIKEEMAITPKKPKLAPNLEKPENFSKSYTKKSRKPNSAQSPKQKTLRKDVKRLNHAKLQSIRKDSTTRKPTSFCYKVLHSMRRYGRQKLNTSALVQQHIALLRERRLPLIKRQSIKQYSSTDDTSSPVYFNPQTLKSLSVSILNTDAFRRSILTDESATTKENSSNVSKEPKAVESNQSTVIAQSHKLVDGVACSVIKHTEKFVPPEISFPPIQDIVCIDLTEDNCDSDVESTTDESEDEDSDVHVVEDDDVQVVDDDDVHVVEDDDVIMEGTSNNATRENKAPFIEQSTQTIELNGTLRADSFPINQNVQNNVYQNSTNADICQLKLSNQQFENHYNQLEEIREDNAQNSDDDSSDSSDSESSESSSSECSSSSSEEMSDNDSVDIPDANREHNQSCNQITGDPDICELQPATAELQHEHDQIKEGNQSVNGPNTEEQSIEPSDIESAESSDSSELDHEQDQIKEGNQSVNGPNTEEQSIEPSDIESAESSDSSELDHEQDQIKEGNQSVNGPNTEEKSIEPSDIESAESSDSAELEYEQDQIKKGNQAEMALNLEQSRSEIDSADSSDSVESFPEKGPAGMAECNQNSTIDEHTVDKMDIIETSVEETNYRFETDSPESPDQNTTTDEHTVDKMDIMEASVEETNYRFETDSPESPESPAEDANKLEYTDILSKEAPAKYDIQPSSQTNVDLEYNGEQLEKEDEDEEDETEKEEEEETEEEKEEEEEDEEVKEGEGTSYGYKELLTEQGEEHKLKVEKKVEAENDETVETESREQDEMEKPQFTGTDEKLAIKIGKENSEIDTANKIFGTEERAEFEYLKREEQKEAFEKNDRVETDEDEKFESEEEKSESEEEENLETEKYEKVISPEIKEGDTVNSPEVDENETMNSPEMEEVESVISPEIEDESVISPEMEENDSVTSPETEEDESVISTEMEEHKTAISTEMEEDESVISPEMEEYKMAISPEMEEDDSVPSPEMEEDESVPSPEMEEDDSVILPEMEEDKTAIATEIKEESVILPEMEEDKMAISTEIEEDESVISPEMGENETFISTEMEKDEKPETECAGEIDKPEIAQDANEDACYKIVEQDNEELGVNNVEDRYSEITSKSVIVNFDTETQESREASSSIQFEDSIPEIGRDAQIKEAFSPDTINEDAMDIDTARESLKMECVDRVEDNDGYSTNSVEVSSLSSFSDADEDSSSSGSSSSGSSNSSRRGSVCSTISDEAELDELGALEKELLQQNTKIELSEHANHCVTEIDDTFDSEMKARRVFNQTECLEIDNNITSNDIAHLKKILGYDLRENDEERNDIGGEKHEEKDNQHEIKVNDNVLELFGSAVEDVRTPATYQAVEVSQSRMHGSHKMQTASQQKNDKQVIHNFSLITISAPNCEVNNNHHNDQERNVAVSKLSDLCKVALNSSFVPSELTMMELNGSRLEPIAPIERELSVEEALAEMYSQVGDTSDPADFETDDKEEAQEVLLINLEEILHSDSDLYVLQCDMNENILSVVTHSDNDDDSERNNINDRSAAGQSLRLLHENDETVNTLQLVEILNASDFDRTDDEDDDNYNNDVVNFNENQARITNSNDSVIVLDDTTTTPPTSPAPALISEATPMMHELDDSLSGAAHFNQPTIHHEEIVPDNYKKFESERFLKYLHEKYVQKNITKFYHANRVLKKYRRRLAKKLLNAMAVQLMGQGR